LSGLAGAGSRKSLKKKTNGAEKNKPVRRGEVPTTTEMFINSRDHRKTGQSTKGAARVKIGWDGG